MLRKDYFHNIADSTLISTDGEVYWLSIPDTFFIEYMYSGCQYTLFDIIIFKSRKGNRLDIAFNNDIIVPCYFWYDVNNDGTESLNVSLNVRKFNIIIKMEFNHNNKFVIKLRDYIDKRLTTYVLSLNNEFGEATIKSIVNELWLPKNLAKDIENVMLTFWHHYEKFDLRRNVYI